MKSNMGTRDCLKRHSNYSYHIQFSYFQYLSSPTVEEEKKLFEKFFAAGVYMAAGMFFPGSVPGFFRVIFTMPQELTEKGTKWFLD